MRTAAKTPENANRVIGVSGFPTDGVVERHDGVGADDQEISEIFLEIFLMLLYWMSKISVDKMVAVRSRRCKVVMTSSNVLVMNCL